ncbi:MAG: hypothetical protein RIR00_2027 [Pseudomonadota bacterium]|jgi:chemotaxis protein CheX
MRELSETEFKVFVDAVRGYFQPFGGQLEVRAAYLSEGTPNLHPYIGIIPISGAFSGQIYLSAPAALLRQLLRSFNEPNTSEDNLLDAVGELANTLAGSVRRHFGPDLEVAVPVTLRPGDPPPRHTRKRAYTIAISWCGFEGLVVVDLAAN